MTHQDILLVQHSWQSIRSMKRDVAELFYLKLFDLDPAMRRLFEGDMEIQGARFVQMIDAAVRGLDRLDALLPVVRELGARHYGYGVRDHHYGSFGVALLWTLDQALRGAFTPEMKSAWIKIYGVISQTMREAGAAHEAA